MAFSRDNKTQHDANPDAADDTGAEYYLQAIKVVGGVSTDVSMNVAQSRAIIGTVPAPADIFLMSIDPESLIAAIGPITQDHNQFKIQLNDITPPTIGDGTWTLTRTPSNYVIATAWTEAILQAGMYSLFVNDGSSVTQVFPNQSITATTTQTVPQTPNDVNFPSLTGAVKNTTVGSNKISISGLLAPTAITIADGTYSKNDGTAVSTAGVIENGDTIQLFVDLPNADSTPATVTVQLGLREETWIVTTAATGIVAGIIGIVAATYSAAEGGTLAITLRNTGKTTGIAVGCRVSTQYDSSYHTAAPTTNYVAKSAELVEWGSAVTADQTVTLTLVDNDELLDNVGELVIDSGSEFGGATIDSDLDATLFTITGTGASSAYQQEATGDHIVKVNIETGITTDAGVTNTPGSSGESWGAVSGNGGSYQALPVSLINATAPGYSDGTASLEFDIDFQVSGDHHFWLDCMAVDGSSNSCWIGVDGNENGSLFGTAISDGTYQWSDNSAGAHVINIPTIGTHTFSVWPREGGFNLTTVLITDSSSYDADTSGDAESQSAFSSASGGANPNNPTLPQGPAPIVDDKTPDHFVFGALVDQTVSATNIESALITLLGVNVETEISIAAGSDASAEYEIDGGGWVTTAGTIFAGQTVQCRLDMSGTQGITTSMVLTIGTVDYPFSGKTEVAGFIVLPIEAATVNITSSSTTITDREIVVPSGPCVTIAAGVDGTVFDNVRLISGDDMGIVASSAHGSVEIVNAEISAGQQGIRLASPSAVSITDTNLVNCETSIAIYGSGSGQIFINDNYFKNASLSATPGRGGNHVQFQWIQRPGTEVRRNIMLNDVGESNPEDIISCYKSDGTAASPIWIAENRIRGGGPSMSGSAIQMGDRYGRYYLAELNTIFNGPQSGIGISGDGYITVRSNDIFNDAMLDHQNNGIVTGYTRWQTALACAIDPSGSNCDEPRITASPVGIVVEMNKVHFWQSPEFGNPIWELSPYFKVPTDFTPTPAGWSTNLFDTDESQTSGLTSAIWNTDWDDMPPRIT